VWLFRIAESLSFDFQTILHFADARAINEEARALCAHRIEAAIQWVPEHSGILRNKETDRQAHKARHDHVYTVHERIYTSAVNRVRWISEGRTVAKAQWEADTISNHSSYTLKGKAGSKRPIAMTSVKSLATMFYRLNSRHAPTGMYLKQFKHREDDKLLMMQRRDTTDAGASLPQMQPVERPAESTLDGGGEGCRMKSGQMPTCGDF